MSAMRRDSKEKQFQALADDDIVTKRKLPRRSFLSESGALLAGVAGLVSGARASPQQNDPDKRPEDQPKPDDRRKPDDQRKGDDKRKPDDRPKPDDKRKPDDQPKRPNDPDKPNDPHR